MSCSSVRRVQPRPRVSVGASSRSMSRRMFQLCSQINRPSLFVDFVSPTPLPEVHLVAAKLLVKVRLPRESSIGVGPHELHAGKVVSAIEPTAYPEIISVMTLGDG